MFTAVAHAYDPATREWTQEVNVKFERLIEAKYWCQFQRDWMKDRYVIDDQFNVVYQD